MSFPDQRQEDDRMKAAAGRTEEFVCFLLSPNTYTSFSPEKQGTERKWAECVAGGNGKGEMLSRDRKRWALDEWEGIKKGQGDTGYITPSLPAPGNIPPNLEVGGGKRRDPGEGASFLLPVCSPIMFTSENECP